LTETLGFIVGLIIVRTTEISADYASNSLRTE